jgi:predicted DCC family thiol-disulfide oxidoreductase YuxK
MLTIRNTHHHIILFDGICNLCSGIIRFIIKRDTEGKFRVVPFQSEMGIQLMKQYGFTEDRSEFIVYLKEGKRLIRSTAVLTILNDLGGTW